MMSIITELAGRNPTLLITNDKLQIFNQLQIINYKTFCDFFNFQQSQEILRQAQDDKQPIAN